MKIRQCFLELQLKMLGMFFLRHTVQANIDWKSADVGQFRPNFHVEGEYERLQNRPH